MNLEKTKNARPRKLKGLLAVLIVVGVIGALVPLAIRKINIPTKETNLDKVIVLVNYDDIARKTISLPFTWGLASADLTERGTGVNFFAIKNAFPHGNTIRVILEGKAFILVDDEVKQSDAEMHIILAVSPSNGFLEIRDIDINSISFFDFSDVQKAKLLEHKENIKILLEKNISTSILPLPKLASEIYEMTKDRIVLWTK